MDRYYVQESRTPDDAECQRSYKYASFESVSTNLIDLAREGAAALGWANVLVHKDESEILEENESWTDTDQDIVYTVFGNSAEYEIAISREEWPQADFIALDPVTPEVLYKLGLGLENGMSEDEMKATYGDELMNWLNRALQNEQYLQWVKEHVG